MRLFSRRTRATKGTANPATLAAMQAAAEPKLDQHTLRSFGDALASLTARVSQMGELVTRMVDQSALVFLDHDVGRAKALIQLDLEVDSQKDALLAQALEVLARHQPVASDLRLLLAVEHIARDLERSADHAKNIAKRTLAVTNASRLDPTLDDLIRRLHAAVRSMLADAIKAFTTRNTALARELSRRDLEPDAINDDLFHAVIARIQTNPADAPLDIQALFVGKGLERIGDHATNIGDEARFVVRGDAPSATRTR